MTTDIYGQMRDAVQHVAVARLHEARMGDAVQDLRARFDAEYRLEIAGAVAARGYVTDAEAVAKALVAAHYLVTGEKTPVPGVQVKERAVRTIVDEVAALAWARQSGLALIPEDLDRKALLKIASVTPLPFVTTTTEPQVQLDSTLLVEATA